MNNYFPITILIWLLSLISFGLAQIDSIEAIKPLASISAIFLVCFYTYFSPSYFLDNHISSSFKWFEIDNIPTLITGVLLGLPFICASATLFLVTISFPAFLLFPLILIFAGISLLIFKKNRNSKTLSSEKYGFYKKNMILLTCILIILAVIIVMDWETFGINGIEIKVSGPNDYYSPL